MPQLASGLLGDASRDDYLTDFGKATLTDRYLFTGETYQDLFVRVATAYADDEAHAQRLYDYMSRGWFMPSTPILSNGGTDRGLPISCFLNSVDDSLDGIESTWSENVWLAARGGGIGTDWSDVREIGDEVNGVGQTSGVIPFIKVQDSLTLAISQGSLRRGSAAVYLHVSHPEIEEFLNLRRHVGGDANRRCHNVHHGIVITDAFMEAVISNGTFDLIGPRSGKIVKTVSARALFQKILEVRVETGEPYLLFIDTVNRELPASYTALGLKVRQSNLCTEILQHTGRDHLNNRRTAVCCLASANVEKYDEWVQAPQFVEDAMRFLDNVLQDFIDKTEGVRGFENARYSAMRERSVGLGVMGFHSFLQKNMIPFESVMAKVWNKRIFQFMQDGTNKASQLLASERGPCLDAAEAGLHERFTFKMAIAPTASISIICGGTSAGVEPIPANVYTHKTKSGSFTVKSPYLTKLLEERGINDDDTWLSILQHGGSVQHLDELSDFEKDVFKTAFEIDQAWVIDHAADRSPFIGQGQSINVFAPADVSKADLLKWHVRAWRSGNKSLYYLRSKAASRAEAVSSVAVTAKHVGETIPASLITATEINLEALDECLSCQ